MVLISLGRLQSLDITSSLSDSVPPLTLTAPSPSAASTFPLVAASSVPHTPSSLSRMAVGVGGINLPVGHGIQHAAYALLLLEDGGRHGGDGLALHDLYDDTFDHLWRSF